MTNNQIRKLSEVMPATTRQGQNDSRWFLLEHQLYQARVSLQQARSLCEQIGDDPENDEEWELARAALEIISPVYVKALGMLAAFTSLMSGSEVVERLGGIEDG